MIFYAAAESQVIDLGNLSLVGEARRAATDLASDLAFTPTQQGNLAIVVTEAATNLAQHTQGGQVVLQGLRIDNVDWIEVLAIDQGPGMADVGRCLQDGYSTAGTRGQGLGAIARLSDLFDIYSMPGIGTALLARVCSQPAGTKPRTAAPPPQSLRMGVVNVPAPGERYSGDSWAAFHGLDRSLFMVADGLGHGPQASEAALEARRIFLNSVSRPPIEILDAAHAALRKTRGAAMAIAEVRLDQRLLHFAGVGNISGTVWSGNSSRSMVSYNGTIGHTVRKIQAFTYPYPDGSLLIMCSDGLISHCDLEAFPGLKGRHPSLIAAMLYRSCTRGRDDATILVAREP